MKINEYFMRNYGIFAKKGPLPIYFHKLTGRVKYIIIFFKSQSNRQEG